MRKIIVILLLTLCIEGAQKVNAQNLGSNYKTSLGAKGYFGDGSIGGINLKHFFTRYDAMEASLLFKHNYVAIEGIYEWHGPITGARGLKWYVGPGAQLGFLSHRHKHDDNDDHTDAVFALKGTLGLDYKFTGAPINIAFDVNPTFRLTPDTDFNFYAGMAFRFAF